MNNGQYCPCAFAVFVRLVGARGKGKNGGNIFSAESDRNVRSYPRHDPQGRF